MKNFYVYLLPITVLNLLLFSIFCKSFLMGQRSQSYYFKKYQ